METKQVTRLVLKLDKHSLVLILLFLDKSFSNGWGQSTRMEEEGFVVTAELPYVCSWSAFIFFIAVYIRLWQNQSREREGRKSQNDANILGETLPVKRGSGKEPQI